MTKRRTNITNEMTITFSWLEEEITSFLKEHQENPYFVIQGFYDCYDTFKEEPSPSLEEILNFMHGKGFSLISIIPMGNAACKEMVFVKQIQ